MNAAAATTAGAALVLKAITTLLPFVVAGGSKHAWSAPTLCSSVEENDCRKQGMKSRPRRERGNAARRGGPRPAHPHAMIAGVATETDEYGAEGRQAHPRGGGRSSRGDLCRIVRGALPRARPLSRNRHAPDRGG